MPEVWHFVMFCRAFTAAVFSCLWILLSSDNERWIFPFRKLWFASSVKCRQYVAAHLLLSSVAASMSTRNRQNARYHSASLCFTADHVKIVSCSKTSSRLFHLVILVKLFTFCCSKLSLIWIFLSLNLMKVLQNGEIFDNDWWLLHFFFPDLAAFLTAEILLLTIRSSLDRFWWAHFCLWHSLIFFSCICMFPFYGHLQTECLSAETLNGATISRQKTIT